MDVEAPVCSPRRRASTHGDGPAGVNQLDDVGLSDLVGAAQGGSDQAFEDLAAYYSPRLYGFLVLRLGSRDDARDALQETLVAAWRGLPTVRDPCRFWPWLIRIADRKAVDIVRRRRETVELDADALVTAEQSMIELADALQRLPDHFRTVLLARYVLGLNEAETAAALGIRVGTVKARAFRARRLLRERLTCNREEDERGPR